MQRDGGGGCSRAESMNDRQRGGVSKKPEPQQRGASRNQELLEEDASKAERKKPVKVGEWEGQVYMKPEEERLGYPAAAPLVTQVGGGIEGLEKSCRGWRKEGPATGLGGSTCQGGLRADGPSGGRPGLALCLLFKDLSPQHERCFGGRGEDGRLRSGRSPRNRARMSAR